MTCSLSHVTQPVFVQESQCHPFNTACTTSHVCARVSVPCVHCCMSHIPHLCKVQYHACNTVCLLCILTCQNAKKSLIHILQYSSLLLHSLAACSYAADAMPFAFLDSFIEDMSSLSLRDRSIQTKCTLQWLQYLAFVRGHEGQLLGWLLHHLLHQPQQQTAWAGSPLLLHQ